MNARKDVPAPNTSRHVADLLPAYVNSTLERPLSEKVESHLAGCASCRAELASWQVIAAGSRAALAPVADRTWVAPALVLPDRVLAEIDQARFTSRKGAKRRAAHLAQLVAGQVRLIPQGIWLASALAIIFGLLVAVAFKDGSQLLPGLLGVLAPLVSAASVAFIYGEGQDPALELALSAPTSPRLVLASRLALVGGYNFALASAITVLLVLAGFGNFSLLASLWLGPMLLLTGLSLFLSLVIGTAAALATTAVLTVLHLINDGSALAGHFAVVDFLEGLWQTSPAVLLLAGLIFLASVLYVPHQTRLA